MKTKLACILCVFVLSAQTHVFANEGTTVDEKLLKAFKDAFPLAEKVDWNETGDHYFVHFKDHDVLSEIEYDREGNFIESERYYKSADLLPIHLSWVLHKRFANKTIYGITETISDDATYYYVKLEDSKEWVTVKCTADGILEVFDRLKKQI